MLTRNNTPTTFRNLQVNPRQQPPLTNNCYLYSGVGIPALPSEPDVANTIQGALYFDTTQNLLFFADQDLTWKVVGGNDSIFAAPAFTDGDAPANGLPGEMYYNTTHDLLKTANTAQIWQTPYASFVAPNFANAPPALAVGELYYNTTSQSLWIAGSNLTWIQIPNIFQVPTSNGVPAAPTVPGQMYYNTSATDDLFFSNNALAWQPVPQTEISGFIQAHTQSGSPYVLGGPDSTTWLIYGGSGSSHTFVPNANTQYYATGNGFGIQSTADYTANVYVTFTVTLALEGILPSGPGYIGVALYKNGSIVGSDTIYTTVYADGYVFTTSATYVTPCAPNDYFQIYGYNRGIGDVTNFIQMRTFYLEVSTFK